MAAVKSVPPIIMKKLLLLFFVAAAGTATAQTPVTFGARAGVSVSGMRGDGVSNLQGLLDYTQGRVTTSDRTGFYAGAYANIPLGTGVSVEPGLTYTQKGYNVNGELGIKGLDFLGANAKVQLQNDYIDVPLLLKYQTGGLSLFAGPQFSFLVNSNLRTTASVLGVSLLNKNIDASNQFNKTDVALTGGIGYALTKNVSINAAYDYGLQKVDANQRIASFNRGAKIGLSVGF